MDADKQEIRRLFDRYITAVLVKRKGHWLMRAVHNTRLNGLDDFTPDATRPRAAS